MPPFSILHVCMGNICRSPMAERILLQLVTQRAGEAAEELLLSHSVGVGQWHVGQKMNSSAARQLRQRGISDAGFQARHIEREHIESSDLILTATADQLEYIEQTFPQAMPRTFLLRHFGDIVTVLLERDKAKITTQTLPTLLPPGDGSPEGVHARGLALVAIADELRDAVEALPLDDPWGAGHATFGRVADEIETALTPTVTALLS